MVIHGADIYQFDKQVIDFSSNKNPYKYPEIFDKYILNGIKNVNIYPDIQNRSLRKNISYYINYMYDREFDIDNVLPGNGSVELLDAIIFNYENIIIFNPAFSEYTLIAKKYNKNIIELDYIIDDNVGFPFEDIDKLDISNSLFIINSPNNPTGKSILPKSINELLKIVKNKNSKILLDEAFIENSNLESVLNYLNDLDDIYVLRAFTKTFSLPGLRLGYVISESDNILDIKKNILPWSVNSFATAFSEVLKNRELVLEYLEKSNNYIDEVKKFTFSFLKNCRDISYSKSDTIFFLIESSNKDDLIKFLLHNEIYVRDCESYKNLSKNSIRLAIRDMKDMKYLKIIIEKWESLC